MCASIISGREENWNCRVLLRKSLHFTTVVVLVAEGVFGCNNRASPWNHSNIIQYCIESMSQWFRPQIGPNLKKIKMIPEHWKLVHSSPIWYILWIWKKNWNFFSEIFFFSKKKKSNFFFQFIFLQNLFVKYFFIIFGKNFKSLAQKMAELLE